MVLRKSQNHENNNFSVIIRKVTPYFELLGCCAVFALFTKSVLECKFLRGYVILDVIKAIKPKLIRFYEWIFVMLIVCC